MINDDDNQIDNYIDQFINDELNSLINGDIGLSTCQFFKANDCRTAVPFASGVMVELDGSSYIITASHVIEDWSNDNKLFVPFDDTYISVVGHAHATELDKSHRLDVGYIKLAPKIVPLLRQYYRFIPLQKMLHHNKSLLEPNYCIFGYPVINQKKVDGKSKTFGSAYFTVPAQDKVFKYYGLNPLAHYVFEFKGKAVNTKTNQLEKIKTEHYGLSGCGVWYTDLRFDKNILKSSAHLIGIMIEFRKGKFECLIGNRLEVVLASIGEHEGFKLKANASVDTRKDTLSKLK